MKLPRPIALFAFIMLPLVSACGGDATDPGPAHPSVEVMTTQLVPVEPRTEDGVQVVDVAVGASLEPGALRLEAGAPARLVLTRITDDTCVKEILIPALEIGPVDLPLGEAIAIEFTPTDAGEFTFVCGMDMETGSLVVQS